MTDVDLFVPWGGSPEDRWTREEQLAFVESYALDCFPGWYRGTTDTPGVPFTRAAACNLAAQRSRAEVIVFLDADSIVPAEQLVEAVLRVREQGGAHRAYSEYLRLSERATRELGHWSEVERGEIVWRQERTPSHGAWAVDRETFVALGGYDPRFVYFYDDLSFDIRAQEIPQSRVEGPLYHLWHPPREAPDSDEELWRRYEHEDPVEVRAEAGWPL